MPPDTDASTKPAPKRPFFMRQKIMQRMLYALVPVAVSGIYFFGWRVVALLLVCNVVGVATEYITSRKRGQPVSMACLVTCWLYALALPPTTPYWIAAVGVVVGILFGKEVFGGFARNFANPAIVGRAFVYVCFPKELTGSFVPAFRGFPGGFAEWAFTSLEQAPDYVASAAARGVDAVTSASPMWALRDFGYETSYLDLFLGTIGGVFETPTSYGPRVLAAGSIGEACVPIIVLAGVYLVLTKTANWRLMLMPFVGAASAWSLLTVAGASDVAPLGHKLLAGAFFYVSVYMITEPISAPKRPPAMWVYGFVIGFLIIVLSWKSQFVAAASFAILLGNIFAPLMDMGATELRRRKRAREKPPEKPETEKSEAVKPATEKPETGAAEGEKDTGGPAAEDEQ